jgi:hypothetical protein
MDKDDIVMFGLVYSQLEHMILKHLDLLREAQDILESEEYLDTAIDLVHSRRFHESYLATVYCLSRRSERNVKSAYAILGYRV